MTDEELKYLWCLEHKKYAWHFHLLANNAVNSKVFRSAWDFGKVHIENLDDREYHSVGEYMMKEQYIHEDDRKTKVQRCYGSSRNLYRPEAEIELLADNNWSETPTEEDGWMLVEDSVDNGEVVIEGIDATFRLILTACFPQVLPSIQKAQSKSTVKRFIPIQFRLTKDRRYSNDTRSKN